MPSLAVTLSTRVVPFTLDGGFPANVLDAELKVNQLGKALPFPRVTV